LREKYETGSERNKYDDGDLIYLAYDKIHSSEKDNEN
jgi:hypothetical protein